MILDEVQTGMGRTGKWFGYQHFDVEPDVITMAKTLGGGVAIGAMMARAQIAACLVPGKHASTFGGNCLACAAAIATIETIEEGHLLGQAVEMGRYAQEKLRALKKKYPVIDHVRGIGLMIGIQLTPDIHWRINSEANSIAIIVQHLRGNLVSRWTDFLTTDGNKRWRDRDGEFEPKQVTKTELLKIWEEGWRCALSAIDGLSEEDLTRKITIRSQELDVTDACIRNIVHCGYHVGQMVHIAKERLGEGWQTLSITRGKSKEYRPQRKD